MLQAIIVKNPKWEPYTKASDAFKSLTVKDGETAVLVVRGRCKEKNVKSQRGLQSGKTAEWLKKQTKDVVDKVARTAKAILPVLFIVAGFNVLAQDNIASKVTSTTLTNLQVVSSAYNGTFTWRPNQIAVFQLSVTGTNAAAVSNVVVKLDCSDNGTDWKTNQLSITAPSGGAGTGTDIVKLTNSGGAVYWRVGWLVNSNLTTVTIPRFSFRPVE